MEEDEYKAWEDVRSLVMVLEEEEGAWIDGDIKIKNIKIRKPTLALDVKGGGEEEDGGRSQAPVLVSKEERPYKEIMGDSQEDAKMREGNRQKESTEQATEPWWSQGGGRGKFCLEDE